MHKVTAPAGAVVHGPHDVRNLPPRVWFVDGIAYTDEPAFLTYFRQSGYLVEPGEPPADYLAAVERLREQVAADRVRPAVATQDAMEPGRRNYH